MSPLSSHSAKGIRVLLLAALPAAGPLGADLPDPGTVPEDFPRFSVPGYETEFDSLRLLHWMHYGGAYGGGTAQPYSTLWDEWMAAPSLWPAHGARMDGNRERWKERLLERVIFPDGYVSSHMGGGLAHRGGWPFPHWWQGRGGVGGWHFTWDNVPGWPGRSEEPDTPEGWTLSGASDEGVGGGAWNIRIDEARAVIAPPQIDFGHVLEIHPPPPEGAGAPAQTTLDPEQSPFLELRWRAEGIEDAEPYVEWRLRRAGSPGPAPPCGATPRTPA